MEFTEAFLDCKGAYITEASILYNAMLMRSEKQILLQITKCLIGSLAWQRPCLQGKKTDRPVDQPIRTNPRTDRLMGRVALPITIFCQILSQNYPGIAKHNLQPLVLVIYFILHNQNIQQPIEKDCQIGWSASFTEYTFIYFLKEKLKECIFYKAVYLPSINY